MIVSQMTAMIWSWARRLRWYDREPDDFYDIIVSAWSDWSFWFAEQEQKEIKTEADRRTGSCRKLMQEADMIFWKCLTDGLFMKVKEGSWSILGFDLKLIKMQIREEKSPCLQSVGGRRTRWSETRFYSATQGKHESVIHSVKSLALRGDFLTLTGWQGASFKDTRV